MSGMTDDGDHKLLLFRRQDQDLLKTFTVKDSHKKEKKIGLELRFMTIFSEQCAKKGPYIRDI